MQPAVCSSLALVKTPALVLNLDALERNLRRMADLCAAAGVALRPHTKTHRSPWIAHRQLELGAAGVAAATLDDTERLVKAGVRDVLVTSPIAPAAAERFAALAELAQLSIVVDDPATVRALAAAGSARGLELPVLIDVDVGQGRTGTEPAAAAALGELVGETDGVRLAGLQGYEGHCMLSPGADGDQRARCTAAAYERLEVAKAAFADRGLPLDWVTGAGTGTHALAIEAGVFTELQPGSYCMMDTAYRTALGAGFEQALTVVASVVSANRTGGVTVNAGWKALSVDAGLPGVRGSETGRYQFAGDEHGKVTGVDGLRIGDTVELIPSHCDTTIHLHHRYTLVRDDGAACGALGIRV